MYKIGEISSRCLTHCNIAVLFNHHVGPIMIICQIKKDIYQYRGLVQFRLELTGGGYIDRLSWDVLYRVI